MARGSHHAERLVFAAASAALAGACAFAFGNVAGAAWASPIFIAAGAVALGAAVFVAAMVLLMRIAASEPLALPAFETVPVEPGAVEADDELLLTEAWLPASAAGDELLLDDVLEPASSEARVIRLFDPQTTPPVSVPPDASEALRQALSELRRSLR